MYQIGDHSPDGGKMTKERFRFCELVGAQLAAGQTRNNSAAYRLAYDCIFGKHSKKAGQPFSDADIWKKAYHLSKLSSIQDQIEEVRAEIIRQKRITAEQTLDLIARQAYADARELSEHYVCACRYCWGDDNRYQRTVMEMQRDRETHENHVNGLLDSTDPKDHEKARRIGDFDEKGGIGFDPRKRPNPECCECHGFGEGRTVFKDTRDLSPDAQTLYAGVKQTKDGLQILTHSQDAARAQLAKITGLLVDKVDLTVKMDKLTDEELDELERLRLKLG